MGTNPWYNRLNYSSSIREHRTHWATFALNHPRELESLLQLGQQDLNTVSDRALWIVEFVAKQQLPLLYPHLALLMAVMGATQREASVRSIAKITELLMLQYYSKKDGQLHEMVQKSHLERIAEHCFSWLLGSYKVAAKAHSMTCLYWLGTDFDWIHPELQAILQQHYTKGSAGYRARARMVLDKLS